MAVTLIRVDRNGTKYFKDDVCPKCSGTGYVRGYEHVQNGVCFLCGGSGVYEQVWKEMTPEYAQKLADRRLARAKVKSEETNKRFLDAFGFSADGYAWLVMGDTYSIKDDLKEAGAKFHSDLGWHFDHEADDDTIKISVDDVTHKGWAGEYLFNDDMADYVADLKTKNAPKSDSEWIGEIGEKVSIKVEFVGCHSYETHFTFYGETHNIYKFKDEAGNMLIWNTSSWQDIDEGKTYILTGKIKDHSDYKGEKQTVLTRCKVEEA